MKIENITIEKVKGIKKLVIDLNLFPNKPTIFVAQNGFGKSSFAIAFDSLTPSKIVLNKEHFHMNDEANHPSIEITVNDEDISIKKIADSIKNEIKDIFSVFVINSKLVSKAKVKNINGFRVAQSTLEVEPIVIINTIPEKRDFLYNFTEQKRAFGINGKILCDISSLLHCDKLLRFIREEIDFSKFCQKKYDEGIVDIIKRINERSGTAEVIKTWINENIEKEIIAYEEISKLNGILIECSNGLLHSFADRLAALLQIIALQKSLSRDFNKAIEYHIYLNEKAEYTKVIESVNSSRKTIKPVEDGRKLVVNFPKANEISNGQRDVVVFIVMLAKARLALKKKNNILIIDEIFDYLDDANIITFQYYITQFIEEYKKSDRNIFPIMLTHLDPIYFKHFCFNKHKMQVKYLSSTTLKPNMNVVNLIKKREEAIIENELDLHYFHYHPEDIDLSVQFTTLGLYNGFSTASMFISFLGKETDEYLRGKTYDPFAICFELRIHIEKLIYCKLGTADLKEKLIAVHGTAKKIDFAEENGINIPEIFCLLGVIYNDKLHWHDGYNVADPLFIKLENTVIKKMIAFVLKTTGI